MNKPRLIDVNEALEILKFHENEPNGISWAIREIKDLPTAYDIDKVIKELIDNTQECTDRITYETHSFVPLFDAIKIVKGGAK